MKKINIILTTKNRIELFKRSFNSIINNIIKISKESISINLIVHSNSNKENFKKEKHIIDSLSKKIFSFSNIYIYI